MAVLTVAPGPRRGARATAWGDARASVLRQAPSTLRWGAPATARRNPARLSWPALALALLASGGCASLEPLPLRPEPIAYADTLPIREPRERRLVEQPERWDRAFIEEAGKVVDLHTWVDADREALNLTHFDDVVSSAWFEHRNGRERLSPAEVRRGAARAPGPDTSGILRVVAAKVEGAQPGFTVRDARGATYLFKFDPAGHLRLASSADAITSRLYHAAGYHTPADHIVVFERDRLALAPAAELTQGGVERAMREADIDRILAAVDTLPDGRHLALASRFVEGTPKGPFRFEGRRADDPNDHYRHEYRRELRGAYILAAWLNHADLVFQNTMDVWVDPPGYLRHYLIDFASSLGSAGLSPHNPREELEHEFAFWPTMARLFTLGFYRVGWEDWEWDVIHPSIGWLPAEGYDPARWKPNWPSQAWRLRTAADGYWGAKLVASFSDEQIRAAVDAALLPAAAADTLVKILAHRRDRTVEYWYGRVTPIERPAVAEAAGAGRSGFTLAFEDLAIARGIRAAARTRYRWELRDAARGIRWRGEGRAVAGPRQRLRIAAPADPAGDPDGGAAPSRTDRAGLAMLSIQALHDGDDGKAGRPATVYLRWEASGYVPAGLFH